VRGVERSDRARRRVHHGDNEPRPVEAKPVLRSEPVALEVSPLAPTAPASPKVLAGARWRSFSAPESPGIAAVTKPEDIGQLTLSTDGRVRSILIAGRGPTGLIAAILAKMQPENAGTQVYLTDIRAPSPLEVQFGVRLDTLNILDALRSPKTGKSALDLLRERDQLRFLKGKEVEARPGGPITVHDPRLRKGGEISAKRLQVGALASIKDKPVALIDKGELERALLDIAAEVPGLVMFEGFRPRLQASPNQQALDGAPAYTVELEPVEKRDGAWTPKGPAIAIGTPDLVIAADGQNSFTLKQTGIRVAETAPLGTFVAAPVEVPPGNNFEQGKRAVDAEGRELHLYKMVAGQKGLAWVIVESKDPALAAGADAERHFRQLAGPFLGLSPDQLKVHWIGGSARPFPLKATLAESIAKGNVIGLGDATSTDTFAVQGGVASGAHQAVAFVLKYLKGRNGAADLSAAEKGHRAGLTYLRSNAMAWHRAADPAVLKTLLAEIEGL